MAITYPLDWPKMGAHSVVEWMSRSVVATSESPFTLDQQTQVHQGQQWSGIVTLPLQGKVDSGIWMAFLTSLNGREGTFLYGDPDFQTPRGLAATQPGTPVVNGAGQSGSTLRIKGATYNLTGYLLRGDYVQLGTGADSRLYMVLEDADTDSGGGALLSIWPNLRAPTVDSEAVYVSDCKGVFRLAQNTVSKKGNRGLSFEITRIAIVEDIR